MESPVTTALPAVPRAMQTRPPKMAPVHQMQMPIPPVPKIDRARISMVQSPRAPMPQSPLARKSTLSNVLGADSEFKTTRPVMETPEKQRTVSHSSTNTSGFSPATKRSSMKKPKWMEVNKDTDFHWEIDVSNPRNWSRSKRWLNTCMATTVAFAIAFASSIVGPAHRQFQNNQNSSSSVAMLPFALFLVGLAFGPFMSTLVSDNLGRKVVYLTCFPIFTLLILAAGLVNSEAAIIVCRFFAGLFAGPGLSMGYTVIADIWTPEEQGLPLIVYNSILLFGSAIGMIAGGFIIQHLSWSWLMWVTLFMCAICVPVLFFITETSKKTIQRRKSDDSRDTPVDMEISTMLGRPFLMLFTEPIMMLQSLWISFAFGVLYASFVAWPYVFSETYVFNYASQGLIFASIATGILIAFIMLVINHQYFYKPAVESYRQTKMEEAEKAMAAKRKTLSNKRLSSYVSYSPMSRKNTTDSRNFSYGSWSIRRVTSVSNRGSSAFTALPQPHEHERNINIAMSAAHYLNGVPGNKNHPIMPDRVLSLLNNDPPYGELCERLEAQDFKLDRVQLARALVDALSKPAEPSQSLPLFLNASPRSMRTASTNTTPISRSKSMHHAANASFSATPPLPYPAPGFASTASTPPPEWRLWPALPATFLLAASLFMFGWSALKRSDAERVNYMVPIVAMGIFAAALTLALASSTLYLLDVYGPKNGACALAGEFALRYIMAAAFSMFALQMYDNLGAAWASSVFGFIAIGLGLAPWVFMFAGRRLRTWSKLTPEE